MVELILHELRTPLTVASGSIAQAADERAGALSPAQRAHLERARRACASLELVVRQLRDWTQLVEATGGRVPVYVNSPAGLRTANEKLWALHFPELTPETLAAYRNGDFPHAELPVLKIATRQ